MSSTAKEQVEALLAIINAAAREAVSEYEKTQSGVPFLDSTEDYYPADALSANVPLKKCMRLLEGACEQLCVTLAPPAHTIVNRGQDYYWSCLRVANELCVTDVLAHYPDGLHVDELAKIVNIEKGKMSRIMRILATRHCYRETRPNVFANNRISMPLHSTNNIHNFVKMLTFEGPKAAFLLYDSLIDAECAYSYEPSKSPYMYSLRKDGFEGSFFEWQKAHPERRQVFGRAMIGMNSVMGSIAVIQNFIWDTVSTVCDVGSGVGSFSMALSKKYPNIVTTLQDLPGTIEEAKLFWNKHSPASVKEGRVNFVPFDFLQEAPVKGQDVYYLRNIIHNWPDAEALTILQKVREAMLPSSRLLIHDYVLQHLNRSGAKPGAGYIGPDLAPEPMLPNFGKGSIRAYNQDLVMLFMYNSRERTLEESMAMGSKVGLRLESVWDIAEASILEFRIA